MAALHPSDRPALAYGALGLVAIAVFLVAGPSLGGASYFSAVAASGVIALFVGVRLHRPERQRAWVLVGLGFGLLVLGEIAWDVLERLGREPFVSPADAFYLAGYPVIGAGLVLLARGRGGNGPRAKASILDAAIVTVAAGVLSWVFLLEPYVGDRTLSFAERALASAYPLADLLLLMLLARLLFAPGTRSAAFWLLAAGIVCNIAADTIFAAVELTSGFTDGGWLDAVWLVGYLSVGAAGLHPSMRTLGAEAPRGSGGLTRVRLATLAFASVAAPAVLAVEAAQGDVEHAAVIAVGAALLPLLALGRLVGLVRELERAAAERERMHVSERAARAEAEASQQLLVRQNDRLRELDRLKDEFVALVSHELRTPLTSIAGYLELVLDDETLAEEHRRFLAVVDRNSRRLMRLVSDLLFVAQIESGKLALELEEVDLRALAGQSVEALRPVASAKNVELRLDANPLPSMRGDGARLAQLLDNLLSNAVKFTPEGGRVVAALGRTGDDLVLAVSDTGIGVPDAEQRRLFERFFRASGAQERAIEGTGLGLTIARAIVEGHDGTIEFTSVEGEGTTVRVRLPVAGPAGSAVAPPVTGHVGVV